MVECVTKAIGRSSTLAWKCVANPKNTYRNGVNLLRIPCPSTFLDQKRCFYVPPLSVDLGLMGLAVYYFTKLGRPDPKAVHSIFGPLPGIQEKRWRSDDVIRCIAQRGAGNDAPENSMEAFKYCIDKDCKFVEIDVRNSRDGKLVLLNDEGLSRLSYCNIPDVSQVDWDTIQNMNIAAKHPKRQQFTRASLCLLDDALDFLLEKKAKVLIDIKGNNQQIINGILNIFGQRSGLYESVAIASVNPWIIYKIRNEDPDIVAALKYRPYALSSKRYNSDIGSSSYRYGQSILTHSALRCVDVVHTQIWRRVVRWCGVSAVLLHKDIVSPYEIKYWRDHDIRCIGWSVDSPIEKLYWRKVLKAPYIANTLVGEPNLNEPEAETTTTTAGDPRPDHIVNTLLEEDRPSVMHAKR